MCFCISNVGETGDECTTYVSLPVLIALQIKVEYIAMLKEYVDLTRHSSWTKNKEKFASDPRYKAVESSSKREDWFRDYIKYLDAEVGIHLCLNV